MQDNGKYIFVVDDDKMIRRALTRALNSYGYHVQCYDSACSFLAAADWRALMPACLLLDLYLPDTTGLQLQRQLNTPECILPIIFMSGLGGIADSVQAMKQGAVDFLEKPLEIAVLLESVQKAHLLQMYEQQRCSEMAEIVSRYKLLSAREVQVLDLVAEGLLNKQIAYQLNIVEKTVKVHRAHIMAKMQVGSLAELIRVREKILANV